MEDDHEEGPYIGGKSKTPKGPNPLNQPKRDRKARQKQKEEDRAQAQIQGEPAEPEPAEPEPAMQEEAVQAEHGQAEQQQQQQGQSKIPSFGDGSTILEDWTTSGLIGDAIDQKEDTCGSVVFTHLLQASYNKGKTSTLCRHLSYLDLAHHIRRHTTNNNFSFRNLNIPINYIRDTGLLTGTKISGPGVRGGRTKGDFDREMSASRQFVYETLERTPLGIVIESSPQFERVGMGIYDVPSVPSGKLEEHSLLVVGSGITKDGVEFLVVQNSWGKTFGNNGYTRLFLPHDGRFKIYWPVD